MNITPGSQDVSLPFFIKDATKTDGSGLAGLTYLSAGLVAEWRRAGEGWTPITLVAGALGSHTDGGFVADGALAGAYELDIPDAVIGANATPYSIVRLYGAANMVPVNVRIDLPSIPMGFKPNTTGGLPALQFSGSTIYLTGVGEAMRFLAEADIDSDDASRWLKWLHDQAELIKAKTDKITAGGTVTVVNPVAADGGQITLWHNDDYILSQKLVWTIPGGAFPDLTGQAVWLGIGPTHGSGASLLVQAGTVESGHAVNDQEVSVSINGDNLPAASFLAGKELSFSLKAIFSTIKEKTLVAGKVTIKRDYVGRAPV